MKELGQIFNALVGVLIVGAIGYIGFRVATSGGGGGFSLGGSEAPPGNSPEYYHDFSQAVAAGQREKKPIVLIFSASWCPPCQMMKKQVYPSAEVQPYQKKFIWAYLDVDKRENQAAAQRFGVNGIPHIVLLARNGSTQLASMTGGCPPPQFVEFLRKGL